jgi:hypothetical protein
MTLRFWRRFRFIAVFFAINFILTGACFAADPQWVEVRSPLFSVITDAGEKRGREVAVKFEQMRVAFGRLLTKATVNLPVALQIIAFRNSRELRQFSPLWHGKPISLAGLYQSGQDRDFILLDLSAEDPMPVVFHEYAHRLMNGNIVGETQPWFDEGFAEYFATTVIEDHVAKVGFRPPPGDLEVLQQFSWLRIPDLFAVRHDSETYNEGNRRSVFYAESWLVVYYLRATQQFSKLNAYFTAVLDHKLPIPDAIQQAFGISAAQFEKELRKYLNTGHVQYYPIPLPPEIETTGYTVSPIGILDAKVVMADMHFHSSDYHDIAAEEFEQILKVQPDNAGAFVAWVTHTCERRILGAHRNTFGKPQNEIPKTRACITTRLCF